MTNKNPFTEQFIESQRAKLEQEKTRLEKELARLGRRVAPDDYAADYQDYGSDEESNAAEVAQYETALSVERELEAELGRVGRALERIDEGTYGLDINTGSPIKRERLVAYPAAETDI